MVHPYIRRRNGLEKVSYLHPKLKPILEETLGVVLFQEQVIQVAIAIAGFTPGEADSLRRAMSHKRSSKAIEQLRQRFLEGAGRNRVSDRSASQIFNALKGFAEYGFCKSHAAGFALLCYQSAWLKKYYPAEFYAALLNNQPMGFYNPEVVVNDARRHGVPILPVDVNKSKGRCTVEEGMVRLGFRYVKGVGERAWGKIEGEREKGPYSSLRDFYRRAGLEREAIENLILVGGMDCFGMPKRQLLWQLGLVLKEEVDRLPLEFPDQEVELPEMTEMEEVASDYRIQGLSCRCHPMQVLRKSISRDGILKSSEIEELFDNTRVRMAGCVVSKQAPLTAKGHVFLTLEDENGLVNVILKPQIYEKYRYIARREPLIVVEGILQKKDSIVNIEAERLLPLRDERHRQRTMYPDPAPKARNFR
jgi:error-prone DNA polymerase